LEVIPIDDFGKGVNDLTCGAPCPYCPAVLCSRFVEQATPDTHIEITRGDYVEVSSKGLSAIQKLNEDVSAIRVLVWPWRRIVSAAMLVAQSLNSRFKEFDQTALDGNDRKSLALKGAIVLQNANRL
jgi:hypothetical protein